MIKINISKEKMTSIEKMHLKCMQIEIKDLIDQQIITFKKDKNYVALLSYLKSKLPSILCGKKNELENIIEHIEKNFYISHNKLSKIISERQSKKIQRDKLNDYIKEKNLEKHLLRKSYTYIKDFNEDVLKIKAKWEIYSKRINEIFNYKKFTNSNDDSGWNAYEFVIQLGVTVCPYCNRQFINTLFKKEKKARAVIDHFFAKSLYPYLALSLYNLIPCCYFCNSTFKGDQDFYKNESIYPYEEGFFNGAKFTTDFKDDRPYDYKYLLGLSDNFKLEIKILSSDPKEIKKINRSRDIFALDEMYSFHKDYVKDLIRSFIINNNSRIDELYKLYGEIFKNKEELLQVLYMNYTTEENLEKRILSKLTKDMYEEFTDINHES